MTDQDWIAKLQNILFQSEEKYKIYWKPNNFELSVFNNNDFTNELIAFIQQVRDEGVEETILETRKLLANEGVLSYSVEKAFEELLTHLIHKGE